MNNWRIDKTVLVTDAHTIGSLAAIRSLGRAGYQVIAISSKADALGFYSRYCRQFHVHPEYGACMQFLDWLHALLEKHNVQLVIPSEGFLLAIRQEFSRLSHLLPVPANADLVYSALSKYDLFASFATDQLREHLPPFLLVDFNNTPPALEQLRALGEPLFIKMDSTHALGEAGGGVIKCASAEVAAEQLRQLHGRYSKVLVQGYVSGKGVGAFLASWRGRHLGEFMHRRIHEVPHWGGMSSFREAWSNLEVLADARARMEHLQWQGVGMFEYRWDPQTGRFYLMEFNSRFWGSLHLALFAGVDFPCLLADAWFDMPQAPVTDYARVSCRLTFPKELEYVLSCLKDRQLGWGKRLGPVFEFIGLGMNPRVHSDLNFPGDRLLYGRSMLRSFRNFLR